MSVTSLMADLATDPLKLEEFRANPSGSLAASGLDGTSMAAVCSKDPSQVGQLIAVETGFPATGPSFKTVLIA